MPPQVEVCKLDIRHAAERHAGCKMAQHRRGAIFSDGRCVKRQCKGSTSMHLPVDCIHCLCSQECRILPFLCLQLCIKVFSALFVCVRSADSQSLPASAHKWRPSSRRCRSLSMRKGWTKGLLCRAALCQRPTIRLFRRPPAYKMQRATRATSAAPRSMMRNPLAARGVAGLLRRS